jgi:ribose-phosphate pyrophosphokinase
MTVVGEVEGDICIIVDDMADTGGTLLKAAETLMKAGAKKVIACCVHAVLSGDSRKRLNESLIEEVIVTDTIAHAKGSLGNRITTLSVAPLFAEAIRRIHSDDSVSSLFR